MISIESNFLGKSCLEFSYSFVLDTQCCLAQQAHRTCRLERTLLNMSDLTGFMLDMPIKTSRFQTLSGDSIKRNHQSTRYQVRRKTNIVKNTIDTFTLGKAMKVKLLNLSSTYLVTSLGHKSRLYGKSKKLENLGRCDRQHMLWRYLKIWDQELIFGCQVKAISLPGVLSPCNCYTCANEFPSGGLSYLRLSLCGWQNLRVTPDQNRVNIS